MIIKDRKKSNQMKKIIFVLALALSSLFWMALTESDYKKDFYFPSKPCVLVYESIFWAVEYKEVSNPFYIDPKTNMPKSGEKKTIMKVTKEYWDTIYLHYEIKKILDTDSGLYFATFLSNQGKVFRKKELLTGPDIIIKAYAKKDYASCPNLPNSLIYPMKPIKEMKMMAIDTLQTVKVDGYSSSSTGMKTKKRTYEGDETINVDGVTFTCHHFFEKYEQFSKIGAMKLGGQTDKHDIWIAEGVGLVKKETSSGGFGSLSSPPDGRPNTMTLIKIYY